jgi:hypothetical protein
MAELRDARADSAGDSPADSVGDSPGDSLDDSSGDSSGDSARRAYDDRVLRWAGALFAVALAVHGIDHMRRGIDVISLEVLWLGNLQTVAAVVALFLVFTGHRWGPPAAVAIGFASAIGFTVVHLFPYWSVLSDNFPGAESGAGVTAYSWFAALFEIGADLAFGWAGLRVMRGARLEAAPGPLA